MRNKEKKEGFLMIITPKTRGFICTTAHPTGCAAHVREQIDYINQQTAGELRDNCPKKVLILGASMGFGLASRIACAYGFGAATIGVIFDKPGTPKRTASAGWYHTAAFEEFATADGLYATSINGDAFSQEIKDATIARIKQDLGQVDLVIYSLASPKRTAPDGTTYHSVLKTIGAPYTNKTIDLATKEITDITIPPATSEEIEHTVKVMGGEDWFDWCQALTDAGVLADDAATIAYSYVGPAVTHPIYRDGSIGKAKDHLLQTAGKIQEQLNLSAHISVNKALVTQSSAAIPIVPLYITVLYRVMKQEGNHENCIQQMARLFLEKWSPGATETDDLGRIRLDDYELSPAVSEQVTEIWGKITTENLTQYADIDGYWQDFYAIFGFSLPGVDEQADVNPEVPIKSL